MSRWIDILKGWGSDLLGVLCPDLCTVCGHKLVGGERVLCLECLAGLPLTGLHSQHHSPLHERVLSTSTPVERAASMMWYVRESPYTAIIHDAKYRSRPSVASYMTGLYCGMISPEGFFDGIDAVIPVPIHLLKRLGRGYNQAEVMARSISESTGIALYDNLKCRRFHTTQTRKNVAERYRNALGAYTVENASELAGKHVLVVDDVLTTGATMRACMDSLLAAEPTVRLSFLTLAATKLQ